MRYLCIKDHLPGSYFTKGKVYNIDISKQNKDGSYYIERYDRGSAQAMSDIWWAEHGTKNFKLMGVKSENIRIL